MPGLRDVIRNLDTLRERFRDRIGAELDQAGPAPRPARPSRLREVADFGPNPGQLRMLTYVPARLAPSPALVVALHGCGQDAAGYDLGTGWSDLADRDGFVVLCPEQRAANNAQRCFNWFLPGDIGRAQGEAASIRQMIARAVRDHGIDRRRIFVTGLSAGGAMAAVLLAAYPEVFAGGGIVAGLPYGVAGTVQEALQAMFQVGSRPSSALGDLVRGASGHGDAWPRISIWHGDADKVVNPGNARELARQWADVHGLPSEPTGRDRIGGSARELWCDRTGEIRVELITLAGMGHGMPLHVGTGPMQGGAAGPFLLDVGISATHHLAAFWGLNRDVRPSEAAPRPATPKPRPTPQPAPPRAAASVRGQPGARPHPTEASGRNADPIGTIIKDALRAAGLLRD